MSDWTKTTLGEIAKIITGPFGSQLHSYEYVESGTPVIMPQNIGDRMFSTEKVAYINDETAERLKRYVTVKNDIVYSRRGNVEKHAFITKEHKGAICGTGCFRVRTTSNEVLPMFLSLYLNRPEIKLWLVQHAVGSNMPNLNTGILSNVPIAYPDMLSQKAISSVLSKIDRKIALNNAINAELESTARTLYDYWFTQFDFPNVSGKPYKSSGGEMVWNEQLKRKIPKGWEAEQLVDKIEFKRGYSYSSDEIKSGEGIPMINLASISRKQEYIPSGIKFVNKQVNNDCTANPFEMLIACTDLTRKAEIIGCPIIVPKEYEKYVFSMDLAKVVIRTEEYTKCYLYRTLRTDFYHEHIKRYATGTNVLHLDLDGIRWYYTVIPPIELQRDYERIHMPIVSKQVALLNENKELIATRDFLLPLLMNGQVMVGKPQVKKSIKMKSQQIKPASFDSARFQEWKSQIGIAARGNVDEQTLKNIYKVMDANDR